jgi:hypothetical protein
MSLFFHKSGELNLYKTKLYNEDHAEFNLSGWLIGSLVA